MLNNIEIIKSTVEVLEKIKGKSLEEQISILDKCLEESVDNAERDDLDYLLRYAEHLAYNTDSSLFNTNLDEYRTLLHKQAVAIINR